MATLATCDAYNSSGLLGAQDSRTNSPVPPLHCQFLLPSAAFLEGFHFPVYAFSIEGAILYSKVFCHLSSKVLDFSLALTPSTLPDREHL